MICVHLGASVATIGLIIPALNEEQALPLVLSEIPPDIVDQVIVVDNGSTDRTADVAREHGALVVHEPERGYGAACLRGLEELRKSPPDIVVFMDADHSDFPEEIPLFIEPILAGEADLVIGSRVLGGAEPGSLTATQRLGNHLSTTLIRLLWGQRFTDLGPFRAIRWTALEQLAVRDRGFGWTIEMQIKAVKHRLRAREVPVRYRPRVGQSKISGTWLGSIRAGAKILFTIFKHALSR